MPTNDADTGRPDPDDTDDDDTTADDGGVLRRLARRSWTSAAVLLVLGLVVLVVAFLLPTGLLTVLAALLAAASICIGAVLAGRAGVWSAMNSSPVPFAGGASGVVGPAKPLSPVRAGAPLRRRLGAAVVPIRMIDGPQPGGGALLIHARQDGVALVGGDEVRVWRVARRGAEQLAAVGTTEVVSGRFVLRRDSDRAVFAGTTRLTDVF